MSIRNELFARWRTEAAEINFVDWLIAEIERMRAAINRDVREVGAQSAATIAF